MLIKNLFNIKIKSSCPLRSPPLLQKELSGLKRRPNKGVPTEFINFHGISVFLKVRELLGYTNSACTIVISVSHVENKKQENNRIIFFPILNSTSVLHVENKKHKNNRIIFFPIVQIKLNNWI